MSFWIVKFMMTFAVIVAVNANIERLRQGGFDQARPTTPTGYEYFNPFTRRTLLSCVLFLKQTLDPEPSQICTSSSCPFWTLNPKSQT
jgi:hypothetical protein